MNAKAPGTDLFAGLFVTFMGGSEEDLIREIHETRKLNISGVILFDYAHLDDRYIKTLSRRVFNESRDKTKTVETPSNEPVTLKRIDGSGQNVQNQKTPETKTKIKREKKKRFWQR